MSRASLGVIAVLIAGVAFAASIAVQRPDSVADPSLAPDPASGVSPNGLMVAVAVPSEYSPEAQIGQRAFEASCAECHGQNAAGMNGVAPPLVHVIYEPNHHGDAAFLVAVRNGVRPHHWNFGFMPPVEGLTQADVRAITRYIRELQSENGIF